MSSGEDHKVIWEAENMHPQSEKLWLAWIDRVEDLMGHDSDGDQAEDGYSLDWFHDMYKSGMSAEQAAVTRYFPI
jgi:hypothetical protein